MKKTRMPYLCLLAVTLLLVAVSAQAQSNEPTLQERQNPPKPSEECPTGLAAPALFNAQVLCILNGPAEVQGFRVRCTNATFIDFNIADCCIPGDHWSLKGKNWDSAPNTAVTTSPGPANVFGVVGRVHNYGGTPQNPGNMDAYVQCTYLHGVDVFPAGSFVNIQSDGLACTITADPIRSRIDRMP